MSANLNALFQAVKEGNQKEVLSHFNETNFFNNNPAYNDVNVVQYAAQCGQWSIVIAIAEYNHDRERQHSHCTVYGDGQCYSKALFLAAKANSPEASKAAKTILKYHAERLYLMIDANGNSALHIAAENKDYDLVKEIMQIKGWYKQKNKDGYTYIAARAKAKDWECVYTLATMSHADKEDPDQYGHALLLVAAAFDNEEDVAVKQKLLAAADGLLKSQHIRMGAHFSSTRNYATHIASISKDPQLLEVLLQKRSVSFSQKNKKQETPIVSAAKVKRWDNVILIAQCSKAKNFLEDCVQAFVMASKDPTINPEQCQKLFALVDVDWLFSAYKQSPAALQEIVTLYSEAAVKLGIVTNLNALCVRKEKQKMASEISREKELFVTMIESMPDSILKARLIVTALLNKNSVIWDLERNDTLENGTRKKLFDILINMGRHPGLGAWFSDYIQLWQEIQSSKEFSSVSNKFRLEIINKLFRESGNENTNLFRSICPTFMRKDITREQYDAFRQDIASKAKACITAFLLTHQYQENSDLCYVLDILSGWDKAYSLQCYDGENFIKRIQSWRTLMAKQNPCVLTLFDARLIERHLYEKRTASDTAAVGSAINGVTAELYRSIYNNAYEMEDFFEVEGPNGSSSHSCSTTTVKTANESDGDSEEYFRTWPQNEEAAGASSSSSHDSVVSQDHNRVNDRLSISELPQKGLFGESSSAVGAMPLNGVTPLAPPPSPHLT